MPRASARNTQAHFERITRAFPRVLEPSTLYTLDHATSLTGSPNRVTVVEADTWDVTQRLVLEQKRNPLVLNMASDYKAGGGWLNGAMAQEEALFYRSSYALTLVQGFYPLRRELIVYSPYVLVFLDRDQRPLQTPFAAACLAVPAVRNPRLEQGCLSARDADVTERKIRSILSIASAHKHDSLVLGALGCGCFHNPPEHVARIFRKVLDEMPLGLEVVFAVLSVKDRRNFQTFRRVLEPKA